MIDSGTKILAYASKMKSKRKEKRTELLGRKRY